MSSTETASDTYDEVSARAGNWDVLGTARDGWELCTMQTTSGTVLVEHNPKTSEICVFEFDTPQARAKYSPHYSLSL